MFLALSKTEVVLVRKALLEARARRNDDHPASADIIQQVLTRMNEQCGVDPRVNTSLAEAAHDLAEAANEALPSVHRQVRLVQYAIKRISQ